MIEIEIMQRAKMYMEQLAQGIDPVSGLEVPEDSVLNNVRLARCFFYVSDVLGQVIANGGIGHRGKDQNFSITPEQLATVQIFDYPIRVTEFTDALSQAVNNPDMKRLNAGKITQWLINNGLMVKQMGPDGKTRRMPTERGIQMGLSTQMRQGRDGFYESVYYDSKMQRFLLDNLFQIMECSSNNH